MPRIKFKATPALPEWRHSTGGVKRVPYGEGTTMKIKGPVILMSGDSVDMTDWEAAWCMTHYPDNFINTENRFKTEE